MFSSKVLFVTVFVASFISLACGFPFNPFNPGPVIPQRPSTASPSTTGAPPHDSINMSVTDLGREPFIPGYKEGDLGGHRAGEPGTHKPFNPFHSGPVIRTTEAPRQESINMSVTDLVPQPLYPGLRDPPVPSGHGIQKPFNPFHPGPVIRPVTPPSSSESTTEDPTQESIIVPVTDLGIEPFIPGFKDHLGGIHKPFNPFHSGPVIRTTEAPRQESINISVTDLVPGPLYPGLRDPPVHNMPVPTAGVPSV